MNTRLKKVRLNSDLSQEEFGKRIGIESRAHISALENGNRNVTERIIKDVCREFKVNEDWLRNGGSDNDMFKVNFEIDELSDYCAEITEGKDPFIADMLLKYKSLSPQHKKAIWEIYEELTKKKED